MFGNEKGYSERTIPQIDWGGKTNERKNLKMARQFNFRLNSTSKRHQYSKCLCILKSLHQNNITGMLNFVATETSTESMRRKFEITVRNLKQI